MFHLLPRAEANVYLHTTNLIYLRATIKIHAHEINTFRVCKLLYFIHQTIPYFASIFVLTLYDFIILKVVKPYEMWLWDLKLKWIKAGRIFITGIKRKMVKFYHLASKELTFTTSTRNKEDFSWLICLTDGKWFCELGVYIHADAF